MDENFKPDEELYRAVYPIEIQPMFWKENGSISSAAFYDPKGLSVSRAGNRKVNDILNTMQRCFVGCIVSFTYSQCKQIKAVVKYLPRYNKYHCEVHGSVENKLLSDLQRKILARSVKILT